MKHRHEEWVDRNRRLSFEERYALTVLLRTEMTPSERRNEWVSFYKACPKGYRLNALLAVLENDGEKMLTSVLAALGLESGVDVIKAQKEHE